MQCTVDKGWSWVILIAICCGNAIGGMQYCSVTIFYATFLQVFDESRTLTSWLGSLNTVFVFSSGSLASYLLPKIGIRILLFIASGCLTFTYIFMSVSDSLVAIIVVYGTFGGIGFGFMITGGVAATAQYFDRHLYKASSSGLIGTGVGVLVYGPLLEWLIELYGWRGAALIFSGLSLQVCVVASTVFPVRRRHNAVRGNCEKSGRVEPNEGTERQRSSSIDISRNQEGASLIKSGGINGQPQEQINEKEAVPKATRMARNPDQLLTARERFSQAHFWCLSYVAFTWGFCGMTFVGIFKDVVSTAGLVEHFQLAVVITGIANVLSRVLVFFLTFRNILLYFSFALLLGSVMAPLFAFVFEYWTLVTASLFMGLYLGCTYVMLPMSVGAIYGRREMAATFGHVLFSTGMSNLGGPSLIGYLRDLTGVYNASLYVLGAVQATGAIVALILHLKMKYQPNREKEGLSTFRKVSSSVQL